MFAHDLCHSQIEYLRNSTRREPLGLEFGAERPQGRTIDFNRKDRAIHAAQALALRERLRCASDFHKYSIFNSQFQLFRAGDIQNFEKGL